MHSANCGRPRLHHFMLGWHVKNAIFRASFAARGKGQGYCQVRAHVRHVRRERRQSVRHECRWGAKPCSSLAVPPSLFFWNKFDNPPHCRLHAPLKQGTCRALPLLPCNLASKPAAALEWSKCQS